MSAPAIRAVGLSKRFRIGERVRYKSLRESVQNAITAPFRRAGRAEETIWALRDVSFEVEPGEVVGLIGRNGAGKSTLLKVLARITEPTEGRVELRGRVGSLLEVGTGFHMELTGRENIYLAGAILGMKRAEIVRRFDEIVAFAEVERFLDTPVKHYSTGMYLRLAFAVAAHLEPEILLVDEVLAVGDAAFQKKCLGKMGEVAHTGRTVVFVSHNMGAVARICGRALLMTGGHMAADGPTSAIVARYQAGMQSANPSWLRPESNQGGDSVVFRQVTVRGADGEAKSAFLGDERIEAEIRYEVRRPLAACQVGVRINNAEGLTILTTADADASGTSGLAKRLGTFSATFSIPGNLLAPGRYSLFLSAHTPGRSIYDQVDQAVAFEIMAARSVASIDNRFGVLAPLFVWSTTEEAE